MRLVRVVVNDTTYEVEVLRQERDVVEFALSGRTYRVAFEKSVSQQEPYKGSAKNPSKRAPKNVQSNRKSASGDIQVCAPIPGVVVELLVAPGEKLTEGAVVARLEAMKMQNNIFAPSSGTVVAVCVEPGDDVSDGQVLLEISK